MDVASGSRTAVLVCQARAVAQGRLAVGRFDDPTARPLLHDAELTAVEAVRSGTVPSGGRARIEFELLRRTAEVMAVRTVAIDDAVREHITPQVVILGAGLDGRAWRMAELAQASVFEVDHPSSQQDKLRRASALAAPAGKVTHVPVDFTADRLEDALEAAGHRADQPTTWIWEGVVPYLTRPEVTTTVRALARRCAPGSRLIVNYQSSTLSQAVFRVVDFVTRRQGVLAHEPWRSSWTPDAMRDLLGAHGFGQMVNTDLMVWAESLGVKARNPKVLRSAHVLVADR